MKRHVSLKSVRIKMLEFGIFSIFILRVWFELRWIFAIITLHDFFLFSFFPCVLKCCLIIFLYERLTEKFYFFNASFGATGGGTIQSWGLNTEIFKILKHLKALENSKTIPHPTPSSTKITLHSIDLIKSNSLKE